MSDAKQYDNWLTNDDAAAIVIREPLISVEGADGVIFPATFAAAEDKKIFPGGYNIDPPPESTTTIVEIDKSGNRKVTVEAKLSEKNVCLIDCVGFFVFWFVLFFVLLVFVFFVLFFFFVLCFFCFFVFFLATNDEERAARHYVASRDFFNKQTNFNQKSVS